MTTERLEVMRGDEEVLHVTVTFDADHPLQDLADADDLRFTAKRVRYQPDAAALIAKALGDGIVVVDATHADITIDPDDTDTIAANGEELFADLQGTPPVTTIWHGKLVVTGDTTRESD